MNAREKRKHQREATEYAALLCMRGQACAVRIKDLSHSGAAVVFRTNITPVSGSKATLHFYAPDAATLVAKLPCVVVRTFRDCDRPAAGLEFERSSEAIDEIMDLLSIKDMSASIEKALSAPQTS